MRTPPLLLGATLLFWGWESGFVVPGVFMAVVLEGARLFKARLEFSDEDFTRIWTLCSVLFLAATVYAFTANEGPSRFGDMLQNPTFANQSGAGTASARTVTALFRWLPMIFFLFAAAQAYSSREEIPWTTISQISRWRWKRAGKIGRTLPPAPGVNVSFPYFAMCLFAASTHPSENSRYFWGLTVLLAWAFWSRRPRRFGVVVWLAMFALALLLGYAAQRGVGRLQNYIANLNPEWIARFGRHPTDPSQSRTSIGHIGRLKMSGRIVIRLKVDSGHPPSYLREASYRIFNSPLWSAGESKERFETVYETNGTTWILLPGKTNTASVQIACYLEGMSPEPETRVPAGLLALPRGCGRLDHLPPFMVIQKNSVGAVLAEGPGLLIFDALYGPGATIDSPPDTNLDLLVSASEQPALDQVISELNINQQGTDQALRAINSFFQSKFSYHTWQKVPPPTSRNETALSRFLLSTRSGHCEYFATATVLLLRQLHIPARYAVGYAVHEASGRDYVVRERDAHAWCLVWNDSTQTWQDFDTTPSSWVEEESKRASPWQRLADLWSWIAFQLSKFRWGQTHLRRYLLLTLAPVLALLLYQIIFRRRRSRERHQQARTEARAPWPGWDSEFYLVERKLVDRGALRRPNEPLSTWLQRATGDPALAQVNRPLHSLLHLHYRYRFDPLSLNATDREELRRGAEQALAAIAQPRGD